MRQLLLCACLLWAGDAWAQTYALGVFPFGTTTAADTSALRVFPLTDGIDVICPVPSAPIAVEVNPMALEFLTLDGVTCGVYLEGLLLALDEGVYVLAVKVLATGTYGPVSHAFRRFPAPKVCIDPLTKTVYRFGAGPPVQVMPNGTVAQRSAWQERERVLTRAGFDVRILLVSTSVYFAVTCR